MSAQNRLDAGTLAVPEAFLDDDVVAAVALLRDPSLPGRPWSVTEVAAVLPLLLDGPSPMPVEAWGVRWLAAADEDPSAGVPWPGRQAGGSVVDDDQ